MAAPPPGQNPPKPRHGNRSRPSGVVPASQTPEGIMLKGVVAWLLGVPLIVIIALYVFHVF